jgi:uncharacterized protein YprB with RNaseH-like and TPR domain
MKHLFIDAETFGNKPEEKTFSFDDSQVKVGNLKDPQKIAEKINLARIEAENSHLANYDKEWRGNALKSLKLNIVCISAAIDDGPIVQFVSALGDAGDQDVMTEFARWIVDSGLTVENTAVVSHNGTSFDWPIIRHRGVKYKLPILVQMFSFSGKNDPRARDTQTMWQGTDWKTHYSMDNIAKFLGFEGKNDVTGAMVHDMVLAGKIQEVADYCSHDVEQLRLVFNAMQNYKL